MTGLPESVHRNYKAVADSLDSLLRAVVEAMGCRPDQDPVIFARELRERLSVPPSDDERDLAQALFRTLYDAGVSFQSGDLIPRLTATVRAAGFRRQVPPSDDEREALDQIMREADGCWPDAREAILATFRRQGPITDAVKEQIEFNESMIAWTENNFLPGPNGAAAIAQYEYAIEQLRAALEAAERVRSTVPSPAEQEDDRG